MEKNVTLDVSKESYYWSILKTAVAFSLIRTKPQHMSGKEYSRVMCSKLTKSVKSWKLKAQTLEEELLLVKEELLQVKLSLHGLPERTKHPCQIEKNVNFHGDVDSNNVDCLTPPSSSESGSNNQHDTATRNRHTKFLRSIVALLDAPQSASMLAESGLCSLITSTVLQAVSVLRESIQDQCFVETSIPECCVDGLLGILDMERPSSVSPAEVTDKVLDYAEEMILAITNCPSCEKNVVQEKYSKLLVRIACHEKTTEQVLSKLVEVLKRFSATLRAVSQEPVLLAENVGTHNNMYYVLWCIENIVTHNLNKAFAESVSTSLMESLEDSVLHLTKTFPLYTHYVWRIGGLLSRSLKSVVKDS